MRCSRAPVRLQGSEGTGTISGLQLAARPQEQECSLRAFGAKLEGGKLLTAARARNLFKRSWAGTLYPLSHAEQRERLSSLQAKVIRSEERAFSAHRRELSKLQRTQSRLIESLQSKWGEERRKFADDSGWMVLSTRWLGWFADDEEPLAPAKLQGTDQGGYAFPTAAERAGKYLYVL